jgi:hypothetical protein
MFDNGVTMWHALGYMYKYDEYKRLNVWYYGKDLQR